MFNKLKTQVKEGHYYTTKYNSLERFISFFYQIDIVLNLEVRDILEIGPGNQLVANQLRLAGLNVETCDFDESVKPDIVSDVRSLKLGDDSYDLILACQIMEHIPFEDFSLVLKELRRASRRYVVISLPYRSSYFEIIFKFPLIRSLFKRNFFDLSFRLPLNFADFDESGQHYWEIDRRKFCLKKIKEKIEVEFCILNEFSPVMNKYHYFFVLEKK